MSQVVIDANIVVKLVLDEDDSLVVQRIWDLWDQNEVERVAPHSLPFEAVAAIRWNVLRKSISPAVADIAFQELQSFLEVIELLAPSGLYERTWEIAKQFEQGQLYDLYYLALAEILDCDFWTADEKFHRSTHRHYPRVKNIRTARTK